MNKKDTLIRTLATARTLLKLPAAIERKRLTNERILSSLKKLGVATREDMELLMKRIDKLEAALAGRTENRTSHPPKKERSTPKTH